MSTDAINTFTVASRLADASRRQYGDLTASIKRYARAAGVEYRTARNHMEGANCPGAAPLIRLLGESEEVLREVLEMAGLLSAEKRERLLDIIAEAEADMEGMGAHDPD